MPAQRSPSLTTGYALCRLAANSRRASPTVAVAAMVRTGADMSAETGVVRSMSTSYSACTDRPRRDSFSVMRVSRSRPPATRSASTLASISARMTW